MSFPRLRAVFAPAIRPLNRHEAFYIGRVRALFYRAAFHIRR